MRDYYKPVRVGYFWSKIHIERITKIKPFIDKYNWERINYEKDYWKKMTRKSLRKIMNGGIILQ